MRQSDIELFTEIISRIRESVGRDEFRKSLRFEKSDHPLISTPLVDLKLAGEGVYDWQNFFHHTKADNITGWLRFATEDRHGLLGFAHQMFLSLEGLPVHISMSKSWRWDNTNLNAAGRPSKVDVYEFLATPRPDTEAPFCAHPLVEMLDSRICASHDPRAQQTEWFEHQKQTAGKILFGAYSANKFGMHAWAEHKSKAEEAIKLYFHDCKTELKKDANDRWVIDIVFPDMIDAHKKCTTPFAMNEPMLELEQ